MMAVTVPPGVKGGMMQVDVGGGQIMQVQVPAGVSEGQQFQMQTPAPAAQPPVVQAQAIVPPQQMPQQPAVYGGGGVAAHTGVTVNMGGAPQHVASRGPNWIAVGICGAIAAAFGIGGLVSIAGGSSQVGEMNDIDASYEFTSLGRTCMITSVQHAAVPERTEQSCGNRCQETIDQCVDTVSYTFRRANCSSFPADASCAQGTLYTSRISRTARNTIEVDDDWFGDDDRPADQCAVPGRTGRNEPYIGHLPDNGAAMAYRCPGGPETCGEGGLAPFVCRGECRVGQMVDCWMPRESESCLGHQDGCRGYHDWAECGNQDCLKLVDPAYEHETARGEAEGVVFVGIFLVLIAVCVGGCTVALGCGAVQSPRRGGRRGP